MIKQNIQKDQIVAMKARDTKKLQTLRYILAQIKNKEIENKTEATDEEVIAILRKECKKIDEAADEFKKGGREDLYLENKFQSEIIKEYLPKELSDEDLKKKVEEIITSQKDIFDRNPNAFIGIAVGKLKSEASSQRIAKMVKDLSS